MQPAATKPGAFFLTNRHPSSVVASNMFTHFALFTLRTRSTARLNLKHSLQPVIASPLRVGCRTTTTLPQLQHRLAVLQKCRYSSLPAIRFQLSDPNFSSVQLEVTLQSPLFTAYITPPKQKVNKLQLKYYFVLKLCTVLISVREEHMFETVLLNFFKAIL